MKQLSSKEIRRMWLDFFESKGHKIMPSKSLVPVNDPSLLWINSGVATLKDYFSGAKSAPSPRMTNSQRSIRTNDIENVGVTARHHTLFEMLGNFSIGDYFKNEVLEFATELLFGVFGLDKDKVYMTYFEEDKDTYNRWIELGIDPSHLISGDRDMNFWDIGQGPCGPDTEIFYDRGEKYDPEGVGLKLLKEDLENDRYVEIWNIVFSQFNNDGEGNYSDLVQKNIDTGAGLERIVSIFQDAPTNFDTDIFMPVIKKLEEFSKFKYDKNNYFTNELVQRGINKSFKVIADHIRAVVVAIYDGAQPSNNGRGYIIRRLLRRAILEIKKLEIEDVNAIITYITKDGYESVGLTMDDQELFNISKVLKKEIVAFDKTIVQGTKMINDINTKGIEATPEEVFELFATYGFPIEASIDLLNKAPAIEDVLVLKSKHADASRGNKSVKGMSSQIAVIQEVTSMISNFTGYTSLKEKTKVIFQGKENNLNYVLLENTPFYATGGGQHKDLGTINNKEVLNVFKDKYGNNWHVLKEEVSNEAIASVDSSIRLDKERNHSATHLLGFVLREMFGKSVVQLGSDNNEDKLRFDFPLEKKPTQKEINLIGVKVKELIDKGIDVDSNNDVEIPIEEGIATGAITIPGEDYGDMVRVVKMDKAIEFCGGTHVKNTSDIQDFKITKFESKGSGTFRIEAITSKTKVQKYITKAVVEKENELLQVIKKNKALDSSYVLKYTMDLDSLDKTILEAKEDNKKLTKASKNVSIDTSKYEPIEKDGKLILEVEASPGEVKPLALALREAFDKALIIIKAPQAKLVALASNTYDSVAEAKVLFPNLKGGGNAKFIMGKDI